MANCALDISHTALVCLVCLRVSQYIQMLTHRHVVHSKGYRQSPRPSNHQMSSSQFSQFRKQNSTHYNRLAPATGTNYHSLAASDAAFSQDTSDVHLLRGCNLFNRQYYEKHLDKSRHPRSHLYVVKSIANLNQKGSLAQSDTGLDHYYQVYAWDVIDIFFATIVASLPALNGLVDVAIGTLKAFGSTSRSSLLSRLRSFGISSQGTGDNSIQLTDKDSFGAVEGDKNLGNDSHQFDESILRQVADLER